MCDRIYQFQKLNIVAYKKLLSVFPLECKGILGIKGCDF